MYHNTESAVLYYYILICEYAKALRPKELAIMQKGTGNDCSECVCMFSTVILIIHGSMTECY